MNKSVSRQGGIWYTLDTIENITNEHDYTLRLDVKTITRDNGEDFEPFSFNIGFSEIKNTTFAYTFSINKVQPGKTYYL